MKVKLIVRGGKLAGKEIPVRTSQFVIGRDESCNLRPASNMVSKLHCAIVTSDEALWARDLKSTNGTFVNNAKIDDRVRLKHGDEIRVGPLALEVHIADEPMAANPSAAQQPKQSKTTRKTVEDDDVCDWLAEEEIDSGNQGELSETPTIMDLAINTDTVPDIKELRKAKQSPPTDNPHDLSKEAPKDSSSAASNILENYYGRRRRGSG